MRSIFMGKSLVLDVKDSKREREKKTEKKNKQQRCNNKMMTTNDDDDEGVATQMWKNRAQQI